MNFYLSFALCLCLAWCRPAAADGEGTTSEDEGQPQPIELVDFALKVVDSSGEPVEGATIRPYAMRAKLNRGTHYGWSPPTHGPQPTTSTNDQGAATIGIPRFVHEKLETGEVSWIVDHSDFVAMVAHRDVSEDPVEFELQDGYRIAATAIDATSNQPITQDLYGVMSGSNWSGDEEWTLTRSGFIVSRVLGRSRSSVRIIHMPKGQPARFSRLMLVERPVEEDRVFLKQVPLQLGTRVEGQLALAVGRPVTNGRVLAHVSAAPQDEAMDRQQLWRWYETVTVESDGSFVFDSLPRGDVVQLIAMCDGWVSRNPTDQELQAVLPWRQRMPVGSRTVPQVFELAGDRIQPTIEMEPTATCKVIVQKPDGEPLPSAEVHMWPNHIWLRGGSTILGSSESSPEVLRSARAGDPRAPRVRSYPFSAKTDDQGVAIISNLHGKPNIGLNVRHNDFEQPVLNGRRSTGVSLEPGETASTTIRMQPKGTQVLGR